MRNACGRPLPRTSWGARNCNRFHNASVFGVSFGRRFAYRRRDILCSEFLRGITLKSTLGFWLISIGPVKSCQLNRSIQHRR